MLGFLCLYCEWAWAHYCGWLSACALFMSTLLKFVWLSACALFMSIYCFVWWSACALFMSTLLKFGWLAVHSSWRVTRGVNWQPSKGLNIYRQPRFREIFNRQMTKWQSSVKREIYSGQKKKKKSWVRLRVTSLWGIKCQNARSYPGARNISVLTAYFTDKAIILLILTKGPKF